MSGLIIFYPLLADSITQERKVYGTHIYLFFLIALICYSGYARDKRVNFLGSYGCINYNKLMIYLCPIIPIILYIEMKNRIRNFDIQTKLGSGSYGVIYKAVNKLTKQVCVLKQISLNRLNQKAKKSAVNEATIMGKLVHPFIVRYQESFIEDNTLHIVMEYCDNGDLNNYLKLQNKRPLKQQKIWKFFIEICIGLEYIHKNKILHRDMKSLNIFMNKNEQVKIGDLGVAKMLTSNEFAQTMVGTPFYLSPQLCEEKPYNEKSDIWALGCLLYQLCTYRHPFQAQNQASLILKIIRGKYAPIPEIYSKDMKEVIDLCLERDYKRRPTASNILSKPKIQEYVKQFGIQRNVQDYLAKVKKQKEKQREPLTAPTTNQVVQQKIIKAMDSKPIEQNIIKNEQLYKRQLQKKQEVKRQPIIILPKKNILSQKKIDVGQAKKVSEEVKKQNKNDFMMNLEKMIDNKEKMEKIAQSKSNQLISNYKQQPKVQIKPKQNISEDNKKVVQINKSPNLNDIRKQSNQILDKKFSNQEISRVNHNEVKQPSVMPSRPPLPQPIKEKPKEQIMKVKNQKIVQPKVYEQAKSQVKPSGIIKSGGFSIIAEPQKNEKIVIKSSSKQKINEEKYRYSNKRHSVNIIKIDKSAQKQQSKILFGVSPNIQQKSQRNINIQIQPSIFQQKRQPKKQQYIRASRVRKGVKNELARNAKNASRTQQVSKEQHDLVMNLPNHLNRKHLDSSDSQSENERKGSAKDLKNITNKSKFKLKDIDDEFVLQKYEQMMNSEPLIRQEHPSQIEITQETQKQLNQSQQLEQEAQQIDFKQEIGDENLIQQQLYPDRKNSKDSNQAIQQALEQNQSDLMKNNSIEVDIHEQEQLDLNQWPYDEEPQLPLLQQKQSPYFQQNNPYLVEVQQPQETIQNKISYLQIKLQQNMKRQDQINKLMQIKIDQCRKFIGNQKNFHQILQFFRKKLNTDDEFTPEDQRQMDRFLKKMGLVDQNKFQNVYKIMHFEMQLDNTRKIIQRICKKLNELQLDK